MSDRFDDLMPEFDEYSFAALLREYAQKNSPEEAESVPEAPVQADAPAQTGERSIEAAPSMTPEEAADSAASIADRSRQIVMSTLGETLRKYQSPNPDPETETPSETEPQTAEAAAAESVSADNEPSLSFTEEVDENGSRIITLHPRRETTAAGPEEPDVAEADDETVQEEASEPEQAPARPVRSRADTPKVSFRERFLAPAVRFFATRLAKKQMQNAEAANWPDPVPIRETPELSPRKAGKFYTSMRRLLKLRLRVACALCLPLIWLALGLPAAGLLGQSVQYQAGVSLLLLLGIMIASLDVVATGVRQLFDLRPGMESLAASASVFSAIDAFVILLSEAEYLPFCAIGGVALTAALWGEHLTCRAMLSTLRTAVSSKNPSVLTAAEDGRSSGTRSLLRTERDSLEGIVRRSEGQDFCQSAYASAAPLLLLAALILSLAASLGGRGHFLHTFSALLSVSASFAAFFTFSLPWSIAARRLRSTGAALAGWDGCADIGKTRRIVISDEDLFPAGTTKFKEINVQEGVFLGKVVASTAALITASGSSVAGLFEELVERRGYHIPPVDEFTIHEGGGLSGIVGGENVLVGSAGFMNLKGIRLPQNLQANNSICCAISQELVGVFVLDYIPVTSVQDALVTLMRGRTQTVFAIRDFNINPRMISRLFRLPTEKFNFPPFRERCRMHDVSADGNAPIAAVITRSGMLPLVEAAESGRKVYNTTRIGTIIDLAGSIIGMLIMFLLCRAGTFNTASVGNVLSFMFLWALPVAILSLGQNRQ
ncbi:MAG: hypothetical protein ACI3W7_06315 [Oscillospiraceae bacterium]